MREQRCLVQFIHPGGEHKPDKGDLKRWNLGPHRRKFLKSKGRYVLGEEIHTGEVVFWGEWEAESRVVQRYTQPTPDYPAFLWEPYFEDHADGAWRQNTDPWVFGERFHYTGCMQHTKRGPTQLRYLARGSLVLFGSCRAKRRFVLDTAFVVDRMVEHDATNWRGRLDGWISDAYRAVTIESWYGNPPPTSESCGPPTSESCGPPESPSCGPLASQSCNVPEGQSHRLYIGATPEQPVEGMFSFFPCRPYSPSGQGFARPEIRLPGCVTPNLSQGKKIVRGLSTAQLNELWRDVVRQTQEQGCMLGVTAQTPPAARSGEPSRMAAHGAS